MRTTKHTLGRQILIPALLLASQLLPSLKAEDGYELWMRYQSLENTHLRQAWADQFDGLVGDTDSPILQAAIEELSMGIRSMVGEDLPLAKTQDSNLPELRLELLSKPDTSLGDEGYRIAYQNEDTLITANSEEGLLYGSFALLKHLQTAGSPESLPRSSAPRTSIRMLNHWDNLTGTVERGQAGSSLWEWFQLPDYVSPRYHDYARACASVGINGTCLTNVNANATILTPKWLEKVAVIADQLRPYGVQVYLTARFSAPMELAGLETADPLDPEVQAWWAAKVDEIYEYIPDFGGFVVKANSEGQPGPQDYDRDHADGANMLAKPLMKHGGVVMWRAFVYTFIEGEDRHKQANIEFEHLDGEFLPNVYIQIKNGAIDFQPREPFHPLFGKMPQTRQTLEVQIAQEYLGGAIHTTYLGPLWQETLLSDTYQPTSGNTVGSIISGESTSAPQGAITGVANTGDDRNWTGNPLLQLNWYAYGKLAWDYETDTAAIAEEWLRLTFGNDQRIVDALVPMLMQSRETAVNYRTPLGLHHIMAWGHHYGPGPWVAIGRDDWRSTYYHRADEQGIGFERTADGSDALSQYAPEVAELFGNLDSCPLEYLLWFHHLSWDYEMPSGDTLWNELCKHYQLGVDQVSDMVTTWKALKSRIDSDCYQHVLALLIRQEKEARIWKDACITYFQSFSKRPIPSGVEAPEHPLEFYMAIDLQHVPGDPSEQ